MLREAAEKLKISQGDAGVLLKNIQSLLVSDFQPLSFEQEKIRVSIESLLARGGVKKQ